MIIDFSKCETQNERKALLDLFLNDYHNGSWVVATWTKSFKVLEKYIKETGETPIVTKTTTTVVGLGIDYKNTIEYDKHINGTRTYVNQETIDNVYTFNNETKCYKVKMFNTNTNAKPKSVYKVNGVEISKSDLENMHCITSTEFKPKTPTEIFEIMLNNLVSISYKE